MKFARPNLRARGYGFGANTRRGAIVIPIALAISLGACTNGSLTTGSIAVEIDQPVNAEEIAAAPSIWGQRYAAKPKDKSTALNYAAALRRVGRTRQAVAV
jgi:Flp pilus assembly protein TadD